MGVNEAGGILLFDTAIGYCGLAWTARGIDRLQLPEADAGATLDRLRDGRPDRQACTRPPASMRRAAERIAGHLAGRPDPLRDVPVDLSRAPAFARRVYLALRQVDPGKVVTYGELARRAGSPGAARAVGRAMAANPLPLLVPCHRVVAANGGLGGFSASGGPALKARLLSIEGVSTGLRHESEFTG